MKTYLMKI